MSHRDPEPAWMELLLRVDPRDAELVTSALTDIASGGVVEEPAIRPRDDGDFAYDLVDAPTLLRAYWPAPVAPATRRAVRRRLSALPLQTPLPRFRWSPLAPVDWVEEWRRFYAPIEVGHRLLLCPSWLEPPVGDRVVIELDPGEAFGTGQHATTRLCLAALEPLARGARVIDVGCGSGVLAIAAAKLGAREVLACDTDRRAVEIARRNALANGVCIELAVGTLEEFAPPGTFDTVVANISATVTAALIPGIVPLLAPGGRAILSGFLARDRALVTSAVAGAGLEPRDEASEDGWCVLVAERPGSARPGSGRP